jgi:hypothetical protein
MPRFDQIWYTLMMFARAWLCMMFVDNSNPWERYFYDNVKAERR